MAEKQGVFGRILGIFRRKKLDPKEVAKELRKQISKCSDDESGLEYDLNKLGKEHDQIIQEGVKAAGRGDAIGKQRAASKLKVNNAKLIQKTNQLNSLLNARLFCELTLGDIESTETGKASEVMAAVSRIIENEQFKDMMATKRIERDVMREMMQKELHKVMAGQEALAEQDWSEVAQEGKVFDDLAAAIEKGDEKKVAEIRLRLGPASDTRQTQTEFGL